VEGTYFELYILKSQHLVLYSKAPLNLLVDGIGTNGDVSIFHYMEQVDVVLKFHFQNKDSSSNAITNGASL
jgi:hypothetical protein